MEIERLREPCPKWAANEIDRLGAELAEAHQATDVWFSLVQKTKAKLAAKDARIAIIMQALDTSCANVTNRDARIAETERCRDNAENALEAANARIAELEAELDAYQQDYKALHGVVELRKAKARAELAEARIAELKRQVGERETELEAVFARAERPEAELKAMREALQGMLDVAEGKIRETGWRQIDAARAALNPSPPD